jgi:exonuclease-1
MGIKGLPEVLRPWLKPVQVGKYAGKRAAVDAYSWLHKGAYSCALELGTNNRWWIRQRRDAPYVRYCIHRAQMLRHYGITPVIVFDGDRLPAKGERRRIAASDAPSACARATRGSPLEIATGRPSCLRKGSTSLPPWRTSSSPL